MPLQLAITSAPDSGEFLLDATPFVTSCTSSTNEHGPEAINATIRRSLYDAFRIYNAPGMPHVALSDGGGSVNVGRLEEPGLSVGSKNELTINALGYWRALSDIPYTAFWSSASVEEWREIINNDIATAKPEKYEFNIEKRLFIAPKKGEAYGTGLSGSQGGLTFAPPNGASKTILGLQYTYKWQAPTGWNAQLVVGNNDFSGPITAWSLNGNGALQQGALHFAFGSSVARIWFRIDYSVASANYIGETGDAYLEITNLRVISSHTNRVNTALTAGRTAGTNVTASVGSTTGMYVGQQLVMNSGGVSEIVTVLSIGSSTQFNATFVNNYGGGAAVQGHRIVADEIIRDLVSTVSAVNPTQLQSTTALVQSPGRDLVDVVYEDAAMTDIATDLAKQGDTTNTAYEVGVDVNRRMYFRPRGSQARTWYIDIDDMSLSRSLDGMYNSLYAKYQNASGDTVRGTVSTDASSVQRYGITRRRAIDVQTSDTTYATNVRNAALVDDALVEPRAGYTVSRVFGAGGAPVPLYHVQACDYVTIRNLPPAVLNTLDTIRTFRITRTEYDPIAGALTIEPEAPLPTLDALVGGKI